MVFTSVMKRVIMFACVRDYVSVSVSVFWSVRANLSCFVVDETLELWKKLKTM